ncbi:MAG: cupredoxin domain-containing protein [Burkholderiales bacterium]
MRPLLASLALFWVLAHSSITHADDTPLAQLSIAKREFSPKELVLPAGVKVKLEIRNEDAIPAEFESNDLSREVIVPGHLKVVIYVGPLKPGRYRFFNDFYPAAEGWVVVGVPSK